MDIGSRIKTARLNAKITQEQAAEALAVSRQTISNWENEKTYPDIISVIKMSDLYSVSLDQLLKGEEHMSDYMDYLKESTDIVTSSDRKSKLFLITTSLFVWAVSVIAFWFFTASGSEMGYGFVYLWILLPVVIFVDSIMIGKNNYWVKQKHWVIGSYAFMYMMAEYATFSMANNVTFNKVNMPEFSMMLIGGAISWLGILIGQAIYKKKNR